MAIRIGLPPSVFPRLRVSWHTTRTHLRRQSEALHAATRRMTEPHRVWWTGLSGRLRDRWSLRTRAIARQRALLESFDAKYEELVDLLCGAAQEGVQPESARQYAALRTWMCAQYRHIRTPMRAFWTTPDAPAAYDPFEALFFPELLEEVIHSPNSIEDMMQARTALDGYRDALEARAKAA